MLRRIQAITTNYNKLFREIVGATFLYSSEKYQNSIILSFIKNLNISSGTDSSGLCIDNCTFICIRVSAFRKYYKRLFMQRRSKSPNIQGGSENSKSTVVSS